MHCLGVFSFCFSNWDPAALGSPVTSVNTLHTLRVKICVLVQGPHCHKRVMLYDDRCDDKRLAAFIYKQLIYRNQTETKTENDRKKKRK